MYTKLTKVVEINGVECVACAFFGTEQCHIHNKESSPDCCHCDAFGAILNQLHVFEEVMDDADSIGENAIEEGD